MPPPAGVLLTDGCSAMRRETRSPFARRRGSLLLARRTATARRRFAMQGGSELVGEGCTFGTRQLHTPTRRAPGCSPGRRPARWPLLAWRERGSSVHAARRRGKVPAVLASSRACMKPAARCRSRCPLTGFAMHHHRSSELATDRLPPQAARSSPARCSPARRLQSSVLACSPAPHRPHAGRSSRSSSPSSCSELASFSPMKLGVRRRRRRVRARWPLAWCSPTITIRTLFDARARKKKHDEGLYDEGVLIRDSSL
ncbi:hypothetical protein Dimus_021959 [Dionaea muscipula]